MEKKYRAEFYGSNSDAETIFVKHFDDYDEALDYASEVMLNNDGLRVKFYYQSQFLGAML